MIGYHCEHHIDGHVQKIPEEHFSYALQCVSSVLDLVKNIL